MATFKLDDLEIPFEPGDTIIRAAQRAGIDIPHYCWHPGLSVAANCRMCLVEVGPPPGRPPMMLDVLEWDADKQDYIPQKKPKLQPACQLQVAPGMEVKSQTSDHAVRARAAVQELLLLNHPVDCPICDQAGECRLQDYWLEHGGSKKRMLDERLHKPKAVVFGPTIVYDAERCIVCTRCVRFVDEVAKDPCLDKRERGNLSEIVLSPGRQLDNAYTLMTEYVCPVGALTAQDFRFKARVWFLRSARSVCTGCATGCNSFTDFDPRDQKVYRYRPRENMDVNTYWMCDDGMLDYQRLHKRRVSKARVDGKVKNVARAVRQAAKLLEGARGERMGVVLSAQHSSEDNFALLRLAQQFLGAKHLFIAGKPAGEGDDILRHVDKNPNRRGVVDLCAPEAPAGFAEVLEAVKDGRVKYLLCLGAEVDGIKDDELNGLSGLTALLTFSSHKGALTERADVVLPVAAWAEAEGTFVNAKGIAQLSERAVACLGDARPAYKVLGELAEELGHEMRFKRASDVRRAMSGEADDAAAPVESVGAPA